MAPAKDTSKQTKALRPPLENRLWVVSCGIHESVNAPKSIAASPPLLGGMSDIFDGRDAGRKKGLIL